MTQKEALQILAILKAAYPNSYNGMTKEEATGTVAVWCTQFADLPADIVMMAVHKLISTNKFPPAISEVKDRISKLHWEAYEAITNNDRNPYLSEEGQRQFQRIYDLTREYKQAKYVEPHIMQMLGADSKTLLIGTGGGGNG